MKYHRLTQEVVSMVTIADPPVELRVIEFRDPDGSITLVATATKD